MTVVRLGEGLDQTEIYNSVRIAKQIQEAFQFVSELNVWPVDTKFKLANGGYELDLSDQDVGLRLSIFPPEYRSFVFPYRKNNGKLLEGKSRQALFRSNRPTGNKLTGYEPSYAINCVMAEAA